MPFLARHFRVVTADPRGQRAVRPAARRRGVQPTTLNAADALAVLDATGTESAFLVALCSGVRWALLVGEAAPGAGARPRRDRARPGAARASIPTRSRLVVDERWRGRLRRTGPCYHSELMMPEPHSTKVYEDMVEWALQTDAEP